MIFNFLDNQSFLKLIFKILIYWYLTNIILKKKITRKNKSQNDEKDQLKNIKIKLNSFTKLRKPEYISLFAKFKNNSFIICYI